jgi:hypothetical protein
MKVANNRSYNNELSFIWQNAAWQEKKDDKN